MKIVTIIQARMGATRLQGKMMKGLAGKPVIAHVFARARMTKRASAVWLATTTSPADDVLAEWAAKQGIRCYRGSENDVLDRYYQAAKLAEASVIVRVTGDCPLIDPVIIDLVIDEFLAGEYDYISNIHSPTFPDGLDTEVVSFAALERAWQEAKLPSEREHVTPYIWKHPERFRLKNISRAVDLSHHRWTLDTPEDLVFLERVIGECQERGGQCGLNEILEIVNEHPDWQMINAAFNRNEGYDKSITQDANH